MPITQSRRAFLGTAGAIAATTGPKQSQAAPKLGAGEKPNILFLLSDDHSYPYVGCYNDTNVRTPNLDRLAAEGMKFHRFFTVCPQCVPSRAGYMTGRSAVAARNTRFSSPLARDEIAFPELLRSEAGYYTGAAGRTYHLDGPGSGSNPQIAYVIDKYGLKTFTDRLDFVDTSSPGSYVARVTQFLDQKPAGKPFFLWMNFSDPHHPWNADSDEPDPATVKVPGHLPDTPGMRQQIAAYCGEVNRLDRQVQSILDLLAARGFANTTLVVFAGDNGQAFPHGKGSLYDPGLNVPLLVRWPGVVTPGTESYELISAEDLGPTLLSAAGVAPSARMTGISFLSLLRGEPHTPRRYIFAERGPHGSGPVTVGIKSSTYDLSRCVRSDWFKFIYNCTPWVPYSPVDSTGEPGWQAMVAANNAGTLAAAFKNAYFTSPRPVYELYDLASDPSELVNRVGDAALAAVEKALRLALAEKMVVDFDYLPLPSFEAPTGDDGGEPGGDITANLYPPYIVEGDQVILSAPAGTNYQWQRDGFDLGGATDATLVFNPVSLVDTGACAVRYHIGTQVYVSSPFVLTVAPENRVPASGIAGSLALAGACGWSGARAARRSC